ncbi:predicted protein [Phaeodactylum tricornutum CCAP 1055/1]|jgi:hypothetical protein|uniref:MRPL25 domain-containing protein n=2 Tax=Phaeodactylum tricornutum TaxID=2850 RepID=B7FS15_PHATC|nr:predicted protein [Phaeodactylum tricornutum CCAP 1055/1]EEC50715.1 predicted protein [Phaeodactylum tricornutum CCAP 1055/1]|eukprot:XP_002177901.1 predicted protein [Phaeodactylum tricornutum CCAP 1055/1]
MSSGVIRNKAAAALPRFRSAVRKLAQHGSEALQPKAVISLVTKERVWRNPLISNRIARTLRKQAIVDKTYGSFDAETGIGWDPQWDVQVAINKAQGQGRYPSIKIPKKTKRNRTREARALKIEANMVGMDERMEDIWKQRQASKPPKTFENLYKRNLKVKK